MPSAAAHVTKTRPFTHLGKDYEVVAFVEPSEPDVVQVQTLQGGQPVVITYPDKSRATLSYRVNLETRIDFKQAFGLSAVDSLMDTAEHDIKSLIK